MRGRIRTGPRFQRGGAFHRTVFPGNGPSKPLLRACIVGILFVLSSAPGEARDWTAEVDRLAGKGAVIASKPGGAPLVSHHPDIPLVPASILKILTASVALEELGPDFRFATVFRCTPEGDLLVSGQGDPHLVSEELARIGQNLRSRGLRRVRHLLLDNGYFEPGLVLHGTRKSLNPYDAYNGALCVNFNTVYVRVDRAGHVTSAEPQTPLTDLAIRAARESGVTGKVRINLAQSPARCLRYAGELLKAFLEQAGVSVTGEVKRADQDPELLPEFYVHRSQWTLLELLEKMFQYSNNFMANQIFLTLGASRFGLPATPEKARNAVGAFLKDLGVNDLHVEEGSGLSRRTRVTARQMMQVLRRFQPHRHLLPCEGRVYAKTGTLHDVRSLAGYLMSQEGEPVSFVILLNGDGIGDRKRERILSLLTRGVARQAEE